MSVYNIVKNLSVAVLLTTSISFAMDGEEKKSDDVNKVRLRELSASDGMPLLTMRDLDHTAIAAPFSSTGSVHVNSSSAVLTERREPAYNPADFDGLPLLTISAFAALPPSETEAFRAFFAPSFVPSSDPVVSTRLAFEETSEQIIARTMVPANFIDSLLEVSGGYVEREDLDESESTSDQAKHIVISLVNRINTLEANKVRERKYVNTAGTYTQAQVDAMFAKHAASLASYDGLPLLSCGELDHAALAALFVASKDSAASGDVDALLHSTDEA